jgi:deoxyribonuclease-4
MKIGAHISAAGGIDLAIDRAVLMGSDTIQIFGSPPQSLLPPKHTEESLAKFRDKAKKSQIKPIFLHAPYLINLASPKPSHAEVSIKTLILALDLVSSLGAEGVIFHTGSALTSKFEDVKDQVAQAMSRILKTSSGSAKLIIENSAGGGESVGDEPSEIGFFIKSLRDPRLTTCLDTQHAFATGYNLTKKDEVSRLVEDIDREIGLDRLVALHANDSKVPLGSRRDRHENIGQGLIGKEGFALLKKDPALSKLPWIIEVPGFADKGPDKENLEILRSI